MRISTGSKILDNLLQGGYETDIITTVYGPAGSGKTTLSLLAAISAHNRNKKVIYIDTEGGFSLERLKQLAPKWKNVLDNILFLKPTTFSEQKQAFKKLKSLTSKNIGLIIVDTIAMLYRLELGKDNTQEVNRELGRQLNHLTELARKKNIPILITNQVYADFENPNNIKLVGGDILKYSSKCLIELKTLKASNRIAILRKHRSIPDSAEVLFKITEKGLEKEKRGFRLF
jgi:DNA repair protein RadB